MSVLGINILDLIYLVIIVIFAVRGLFKGLLEGVAAFVGIFFGFMLARAYLVPVVDSMEALVSNHQAAVVIAYILIFAVAIVSASVLARLLRKVLSVSFAAWLDNVAGATFGAVKGLVLCLLVFLGFQFFAPSTPVFKASLASPYLGAICSRLLTAMPNLSSSSNGTTWLDNIPSLNIDHIGQ